MSQDLFDLTDRVALVTGGSRGLGREMVLAFARAGADVVIASRKLDNCEELAELVRSETGRRAMPYACHVGKWDDLDRLADAVYDEFGRVDVLVNNAGMSPLYASLGEISEDLWHKVMDVNLMGPFRLSVNIGERMAADNGGSIIFVSSTAAKRAGPNEIPYGAAKAGVENLAYSLSRAFGPTVRVNCLEPGPFLTDIAKAWDLDAFNKGAAKTIALGRAGEAPEIVGAALLLASNAGSYITGAVIPVDGNTR